MKPFPIVDLFCGAGGTSTGALEAISASGYRPKLTAINHWDRAIETHTVNHPDARHFCMSIDKIRPTDLYKRGELMGLWASPECTHHSVALGGKPINDQRRSTAWNVIHWAEQLLPDFIWVENVPEFVNWGPLDKRNRPLKSKKGEIFHAWVNTLRSIGYKVEWRVLCAADYGDPTTRKRLFILATRGRKKIVWPDPTHTRTPDPNDMFASHLKPWVPARDIIDWEQRGTLLSERDRPLSPKTRLRIINGFLKHGFDSTIVGIDNGSGEHVRSVNDPLSTVTTKQRHALAKPYLVKFRHNESADSIDEPLSTITCSGAHHGLIQPYLIPQQARTADRSIDLPISTITTTTRGYGLVKPYLMKYYGSGGQWQPVTAPLGTVTCKERFALVVPQLKKEQDDVYLVDFEFRMLNERELARGQGFREDYEFTGCKTEIVKQIGNAVPRRLARALVTSQITQDPNINNN
jgi:DNA (cytosine-5)-methyltransferase 1